MKASLLIILGVLFIAGASLAQSIVGSPHDLSSVTGDSNTYHSTDQVQVCIFCHTPHAASSVNKPLWNRNNPVGTFPVYSSPTIHAFDPSGPIPNVSGSSLMCLSCHDGVTALNSLIYTRDGTPTMVGGNTISGHANLNDAPGLTNDHPVSINYQAAITNGANDLVAVGSLPGWALETGNMVQCSSCHDVHSYGATADMKPFLNASKSGSALCLTCHIK